MRHLTRTEFRHDPDDKQRWFAAADACGLTLSEFIRAALDHLVIGTEMPERNPDYVTTLMDPAALAQITGACNNLNQVVHAGHISGSMDYRRIAELAEEIVAIIREDIARRDGGRERG